MADLDLTTLGVQGGATASGASTETKFKEEEYNPAKDREVLRGKIALLLVWTLVGLIVGVSLIALAAVYVCAANGACPADTLELKPIRALVEIIFTPLVGLVGAVTGFYYGEKSGKSAT